MNAEIEQLNNYIFDERFYRRWFAGIEEFRPSLTYVLGCAYPSDFGLLQWRGDVGNKRAEEIMVESGEDGSFVHQSIEKILKGEKINREDIEKLFSPKRALKIMRCLKSFLDWHAEYKPKTISTEYIVWNDRFAGTVDYKCEIDGKVYLIDWKTSKTISNSHKVQVCGYALADKVDCIAILQLGNTTKKKYTFNVLDDDEVKRFTEECNQTLTMFHVLNPNARPNSETFPESFNI